MELRQLIMAGLSQAEFIVNLYTADLTDEELFQRPLPGTNHIAWQLGHLITAERNVVERLVPGSTEPLPEGFAAKHARGTAADDVRESFLTKAEYLDLMKGVRANTLRVIESIDLAELDRPVGPGFPPMVKHVGDAFLFIGSHWLVHSGQWAILRRKLGRAPLI